MKWLETHSSLGSSPLTGDDAFAFTEPDGFSRSNPMFTICANWMLIRGLLELAANEKSA
jgi:hypothetical protein